MSYPEFVVENLGSLADVMLGKPEPDELNADGCFSKESCDEIDRMILKAMEKELKGFYMPAEVAHGSDPNNKWRTVSSLQKAIRFGLVDDAQLAVSAAFDMDKSYVTRRLGVIAVEDCLMGNAFATLGALAMIGHANWRKTIDERRLLIWLSTKLAEGMKDRTAVNLLVWSGVEDAVPKDMWAKASNDRLAATAMNHDLTMGQRMCAAWLLAGTKRYPGGGLPEDNDRRPTGLFRLMVEAGLPRLMLYIAAKTASRLSEAMFATMLLIHEMLDEAPPLEIETNEVYPAKVGQLLGAAYDKHTREGKTAIRKFFRECADMKPFMEATPPELRDYLQGTGVFLAEGGVLGRRAIYGPDCERVTDRVRGPERFSVMGETIAAEYVNTIRACLPQLNEAREKVLWAKIHSK